MKNKLFMMKIITVCTLMSSIVTLSGCSTGGGTKLSSDEQNKFVNQVNTMLSERKEATDVEKIVDTKIKQLDETNATTVVNSYIYSLYQGGSDMSNKITALSGDIGVAVKDKKIDISKPTELSKLPDGLTKGLFQELNSDHLKIHQDGTIFYSTVDMDYVLNKYGKYINKDLTSFINFRQMEDKKTIYHSADKTFDIEEIVSRLENIEKEEVNWSKSKYSDQWISSEEYYYNIVFGLNHTSFIDEKEPTKLNDKSISMYKDIAEKHADSQIGKDVKLFLDELAKSENKLDSNVSTYINKFMSDKFTSLKDGSSGSSVQLSEDKPTVQLNGVKQTEEIQTDTIEK